MSQTRELIDRFLEGALEQHDLDELERRLADEPGARQLFVELAMNHALLVEVARGQRTSSRQSVVFVPTARKRWAWRWGAVAAAAVLLVLGLALLLGRTAAPDELARLESIRGSVSLLRDGAELAAQANVVLNAGDVLTVATGCAAIVYADGSRIEVEPESGDAAARVSVQAPEPSTWAGKRLFLESGKVEADVALQPQDLRMLIVTPHATATVLGTNFQLSVGATTRLSVTSGSVRFSRRSDAAVVEVGSRQFTATGESPLQVNTRYRVGEQGLTFSSLPALRPGDIVEVCAGSYNEAVLFKDNGTAQKPIIVRGLSDGPRPTIDGSDIRIVGKSVDGAPVGLLEISGDHYVIENLAVTNARNRHDAAGISIASGNVTLRRCLVTRCDSGVASGYGSRVWLENCEIAFNGSPDQRGYTHNLYLAGEVGSMKFCDIHDALEGVNIKSFCPYTEMLYCRIVNGADGEIHFQPHARVPVAQRQAVLLGNLIHSQARAEAFNKHRYIQFGEGAQGEQLRLTLRHNTFVAGDARTEFIEAVGRAVALEVSAVNNIFYGSDTVFIARHGEMHGSNNWFAQDAVVPQSLSASLRGQNPGFLNLAQRDFRLKPDAPCARGGGVPAGYRDAAGSEWSGLPAFEFPGQVRGDDPRAPDVGAFSTVTRK